MTEKIDEEQESTNNEQKFSISRRMTLTLLGLGSAGILGSQSTAAQEGQPQSTRVWATDVDAQGNRLDNLGTLTTQANSTDIRDFAGDNLFIDNNGVLNAQTVDGAWGASGEKIQLYTAPVSRINPEETYSNSGGQGQRVIPFDRFDYTNISQLYLSHIGNVFAGSDGSKTKFRLYDLNSDVALSGTEVEVDASGYASFESELVSVDYSSPVTLSLQSKLVEGDTTSFVDNCEIHVWGEIA